LRKIMRAIERQGLRTAEPHALVEVN